MTMIVNFHCMDLERLDDDYLGPPPRFLLQQASSNSRQESKDVTEHSEKTMSPYEKIKFFLGLSK